MNLLLGTYHQLKESGSTGDFPNILGSVMYRTLIDWAKAVPDAWRNWALLGDVADFRTHNRILGYEAEDLLPVGQNGEYQDSKLADAAFTVSVSEYGRLFSINRRVLINDDLNYIRKQPQRFGKAAGRSISTFAVTTLEGNANTFDGNALFSVAHVNLTSGGGSALSSANLQTAIAGMQRQTVLNILHSVMARWLLVPPALQFTARQILNSSIIVAAGTAGTVTQIGNTNPIAGALGLVIDPYLTSTTAYYVLADPADTHVVELAFLNGKQTPDLLVERPVMQNLAGGDDQFEMEFDVLNYKVRYDYGATVALWWGGQKFAGV